MKRIVAIILSLAFVVTAAFYVGRWTAPEPEGGTGSEAPKESSSKSLWICPMHPQIQLPEQTPCPICGMDLVQKSAEEIAAAMAAGPRGMAMSEDAKALLQVETAPVQERFVVKTLRTAGLVTLDETRVRTIAARFAGRLERLFVDYAGMSVRKGEHLARIYSPALLTAQQELLEAHRAMEQGANESELLQRSRRHAYVASREKLRLWGLLPEQIDEILKSGEAQETMELRAPAGGVVLDKLRNEGEYVQEGAPIYRVADLSKLWVQLEVYEPDLPWVHYGQRVYLEADSLPGEVLEGQVAFIAKTLDPTRRSVRVRVNVDNPEGRLKPGLYVRARIESRLAKGGRVLDARLAGKWISPMHPEIIKDGPGSCDVCGMPLVRAEELGYVSGEESEKPLVVPASAVLRTGTRAIVYVQIPGKEKPTYEGREIELGARAGDFYLVRRGLREGERVVVRGAFMIDSALQIDGKPSMMSLPGRNDDFTQLRLPEFRSKLAQLLETYFAMQVLLSKDDVTAAREKLKALGSDIESMPSAQLPTRARDLWLAERIVLERNLATAGKVEDLEVFRQHFEAISRSMLFLVRVFGPPSEATLFEAHCPMAFGNKGGYWLQHEEEILNPYEGSRMLHCGEVTERFPSAFGDAKAPDAPKGPTTRSAEAPKKEPPEPESTGKKEPVEPAKAASELSALVPVFEAYLSLQERLYRDDLGGAVLELGAFKEALDATKSDGLPEAPRKDWQGIAPGLVSEWKKADALVDLDEFRVPFKAISQAMLGFVDAHGHPLPELLTRAYCPMAFQNQGGAWLQRGERVNNPYEGARMPHCGSIQKRFPAAGGGK